MDMIYDSIFVHGRATEEMTLFREMAIFVGRAFRYDI